MKGRPGRFWIPALGVLSAVVMSCSSNIPVAPVRRVTVVGTIRDPDGVPIQDVGVGIVGSYAFKFANTDSTGSYEVQVPEGIYDIHLRTRFDARIVLPDVDLYGVRVKAPATRFDYRYQGFPVSGRVFGPLGTAIDSVWVGVSNDSTEFYVRVLATPAGYRLFLPSPGTYSFYLNPARRYSGIPSRAYRGVAVLRDTTMDFRLEGNPVSGMVTVGATPIEASVVAVGRSAAAEARTSSGAFQMYLPIGDYDWRVYPEGNFAYIYPRFLSGPNVPGPATVNFDLSGTRWSGTVRDLSSGAPVESAKVEVWAGYGSERATSVTDASGQYAVILQSYSRYNLFVTPRDPALRGITVYGALAAGDSIIDLSVEPVAPVLRP